MTLKIQQYLEDLLYQYQVDLCLWGHYHSYERTCPVYKNQCITSDHSKTGYLAPVHAVIGMAGATLSNSWMYPQPVYFQIE